NQSSKNKDSTDVSDSMDQSVQEKFCAESKERAFNMESDLMKKKPEIEEDANLEDEEDDLEMDDDEEMGELDDEELAELGEFEEDDDDELDEEIDFGDEGEDVELTAEQFAKIQKKIEAEERKLKGAKG